MENDIPVTYVTGIATYGFLNGIVNVAFTTVRWVPHVSAPIGGEPETQIVPQINISADLRLDLNVAQQLHEALGVIIEEHTKPKVSN